MQTCQQVERRAGQDGMRWTRSSVLFAFLVGAMQAGSAQAGLQVTSSTSLLAGPERRFVYTIKATSGTTFDDFHVQVAHTDPNPVNNWGDPVPGSYNDLVQGNGMTLAGWAAPAFVIRNNGVGNDDYFISWYRNTGTALSGTRIVSFDHVGASMINSAPTFVTNDGTPAPLANSGDLVAGGYNLLNGPASNLPAVPTLQEWGLIVMGLLLLNAGTLVWGSRAGALSAGTGSAASWLIVPELFSRQRFTRALVFSVALAATGLVASFAATGVLGHVDIAGAILCAVLFAYWLQLWGGIRRS